MDAVLIIVVSIVLNKTDWQNTQILQVIISVLYFFMDLKLL